MQLITKLHINFDAFNLCNNDLCNLLIVVIILFCCDIYVRIKKFYGAAITQYFHGSSRHFIIFCAVAVLLTTFRFSITYCWSIFYVISIET